MAKIESKKKPRASYRRFVYPAPNACWQLDATEYVLTGGRKCVIFQLIDDHSRLAIASHVSWGETSEGAIAVVSKGIAAHGVPQRLLSDNGAALNPSRRGVLGQLVAYLPSLGVEPITGKPHKPTTQGKNERFHQTLFRSLDKQPLAETLQQLQRQVDAFDIIYNTERPHQGLPGRLTPALAWAATPVVEPPRPIPQPAAPVGDDGLRMTRIRSNGSVYARGTKFQISRTLAGAIAYRVEEDDRLMIFDAQGTLLAEYPWPPRAPNTSAAANPEDRKDPAKSQDCQRCPDTSNVSDVLMQKRQRCPDTSHWTCFHELLPLPTFCPHLDENQGDHSHRM
ncbi:hypothetical protein GCM10027568_09390 [Humibacter soli]